MRPPPTTSSGSFSPRTTRVVPSARVANSTTVYVAPRAGGVSMTIPEMTAARNSVPSRGAWLKQLMGTSLVLDDGARIVHLLRKSQDATKFLVLQAFVCVT